MWLGKVDEKEIYTLMIEEGCKRMKRKRDDGDFPKINKRRTQTEEKKLRCRELEKSLEICRRSIPSTEKK
jgi:hypothetical protein